MKRTAERQLTKDDFGAEDEESGNAHAAEGFTKAAPEVLRARRIVKVRRTAASGVVAGAAPGGKANPFAAITMPAADGAGNKSAAAPVPANATPTAPEDKPTPAAPVAEPAAADTRPSAPAASANGDAANDAATDAPPADAPQVAEPATEAGGEPAHTKAAAVADKAEEDKTEEDKAEEDKAKENKAEEDKAEEDRAEASGDGGKDGAKADAKAEDDAPADVKAEDEGEDGANTGKEAGAAGSERERGKPAAFVFGGSAPFVFGGATGSGSTPFASFADAAKAEAKAESFSFSVPKFAVSAAAPAAAAPSPATQKYEATTVASGEEGESEVFRSRAKVFALEDKKWRERGVGTFKMNVDRESGRARLLMRTEATLRLTLNAPLFKQFRIARSGERGVTFRCVASDKSYLVRFPTKDEVARLEAAVAEWKETA